MSTRNIMILTALLMITVALPLGTEYIFSGHGQKYLPTVDALGGDALLVWLHFAMDALIGLSYVAISSTLGYLAYRARKDIPFLWMFVAFGSFIVACGFTHLVSLWTLWQPVYYLAGGVKFVTAVASVSTAAVLPRLIPQAMQLIDNAKTSSKRKQELEKLTVELRGEKEKLEALNKAKDEFISLASHQLRTPATGTKQYIGMILEGYFGDVPKDQVGPLAKANESNERQIEIVNDLLQVASLDAGKVVLKKKPTDVTKLLRDVINEQKACFKERRQKIRLSIPKKASYTANIDPKRMRMVMENLINNASKYTPEGKRITVSVTREADKLLVAVRDEGVGIKPEDMPKLGQKFSRIDNPLSAHVGGSGLGLYWAKKIIDLHGAELNITSEENKGSTFEVAIPTA
ncbi:MAG TPA: HAMP domain-containing sensor histidine kinase [Candidatus Saccharimonadales bacterium]|nr:HAMP domain-containing sensor histidine kinase [Candidatus Saccharimonadales bacterium]